MGLCKITGLPVPSKIKISVFVTYMFHAIDTDGSGVISFDELKDFVDVDPAI